MQAVAGGGPGQNKTSERLGAGLGSCMDCGRAKREYGFKKRASAAIDTAKYKSVKFEGEACMDRHEFVTGNNGICVSSEWVAKDDAQGTFTELD